MSGGENIYPDVDPQSVMTYVCQRCGGRYTKFGSHNDPEVCVIRLLTKVRVMESMEFNWGELNRDVDDIKEEIQRIKTLLYSVIELDEDDD